MDADERARSLDAQIAKISKSTRTTVPALLSVHDLLRQKYRWYYKWHLNPWSSKIHGAILSLILIFIVAFGTVSYFGAPQKAIAASDYSCTFDGSAGANWNDPLNWDGDAGCNSGADYPGFQAGKTYDVSIPGGTSVTLNVNNIDLTAGGHVTGSISTAGTINFNGQTITVYSFTANSGTVTMGASTINVWGNWNTASVTTINVNTSSVNVRGNSTITPKNWTVNFYNLTTAYSDKTVNWNGYGYISNVFTIGDTGTVTSGSDAIIRLYKTSGAFVSSGSTLSNKIILTFFSNADQTLPGGGIYANEASPIIQRLNIGAWGTGKKILSGDLVAGTAVYVYDDDTTAGQVATLDMAGYKLTSNGTLEIGNSGSGTKNGKIINSSTTTASTLTVKTNFTVYAGSGTDHNILDAAGTGTPQKAINTTVGGNWTNSDTFTAGASEITFNKASGTQTLNSGGTGVGKLFYKLTHSDAGTLQLLTNDIDVDNVFTNSSGTFDAATNNKNMSFGGDWSNTGTATFARGSGTLTFDGTSTVTNSSASAASLGAVAITGTATLGSSLTMISNSGAGTLNLGAGSYTLTLTGTGTPMGVTNFDKGTGSTMLYSGSGADTTIATFGYNNLQMNPAAGTNFQLSGHLTGGNSITGNLTIGTNATLVATGANYDLAVAGNWDCSGSFNAGTDTVTFNGNSAGKTINKGTAANYFHDVVFDGAGGAWSPLTNNISIDGDLTMTNGTFDNSNGSANVTVYGSVNGTNGVINFTDNYLYLGNLDVTPVSLGTTSGATAWTFNNLTLADSGTTVTNNAGTGDITIKGILSLQEGTNLDLGSRTWYFEGSGTPFDLVDGAVNDPGTSTLIFKGTGATNIYATHYYNLETRPAAGTPTYTFSNGTLTVDNDLALESGGGGNVTVDSDTNDPNITIGHDFIIDADQTYQASSTGNFYVDEDFNNSGTFTPNNSTVTFKSTDTSELTGSTTFHNLVMDVATIGNKTIKFPTGLANKQVIADTWTLNGALGNVLTLESATPTTVWYFEIPAGFTSGQYIIVSDSYSTNANKISAGDNVTDQGNNDGWSFKPIAPTIGAPQALSTTSIRWTFTDNANNEAGFRVYDGTDTLKATCAAADLTFCDETGLSANTEYNDRYVVAYNASSESDHSATAAAIYTLAAVPADPTVAAQSWTAADGNAIDITLGANGNPNGTLYEIYYDTDPDGTFVTTVQTFAAHNDGDIVSHTGLTADQDYYYKVKAKNGDGVVTGYNPAVPAVSDQAAPAQVTLSPSHGGILGHSANTTSTITWAWAANATAPDGYKIYNYDGASCTVDEKGSSATTSVTEAVGLAANTSYARCLRAYRGALLGEPSTNFSAYTSIETPTGISFGSLTTASINITASGTLTNLLLGNSGLYFTETTENSGGGGTGFKAWTHTNSLTDSGLSINTQYSYKAKARNGDSDETAETAISSKYTYANPPSIPTVNPATSTTLKVIINVNGNPSATTFAIYNVTLGKYIQTDGSNGSNARWQQYATWGGLSGTTNTGLENNTSYSYKVKAKNGDGVETAFSAAGTEVTTAEIVPTPHTSALTLSPAALQDTHAPTAPTNLRASKIGAVTLTLTWDASTDDVGVKAYEIYNADTGIKVGSTTGTSYEFTGLTPSTTYKFYVRAYDNVPYYSPNSEIIILSTPAATTAEEQEIAERGGIAAYLILADLPKEVMVGQPLSSNIQITAADSGGSVVKGYAQAISFSSTDPLAALTYDAAHSYTFTLEDAGSHQFAATDFVFNTPGQQTLTVSDNTLSSTLEINVNSSVRTAIHRSATYLAGFLNNPQQVSWINVTLAALIAGALIMSTLVNAFAGLNTFFPQLIYGFVAMLQALGLRKRPKSWGVVFNAQTGQPIPFAAVKLLNSKNQVVELSISDYQGRYGFAPRAGTHKLKVDRPDFIYPATEKPSGFYEKVYQGTSFEVTTAHPQTFNIPLSPHAQAKSSLALWVALVRINHFLMLVRPLLFALGAIFAAVILFAAPNQFIYAIFLLFCLAMLILELTNFRKVKATGKVTDSYSRTVRGAIVRLYHKDDNRLVGTDISSRKGRFTFRVIPGVYYAVAAKPTFIDEKTHLMYLEKGPKKTESSINIQLKAENKS